jgi:hypothetical protein
MKKRVKNYIQIFFAMVFNIGIMKLYASKILSLKITLVIFDALCVFYIIFLRKDFIGKNDDKYEMVYKIKYISLCAVAVFIRAEGV